MKPARRRPILWLIASALVAQAVPAKATPTAQEVEAAFIPKFARYVTWPPEQRPAAGAAFQLCVIGSDSLGTLLDRAAASQSADQHSIAVRRLASADQASGCHIAFVNGGSPAATAAILAALRTRPVLTVTDGGPADARGMIDFVMQDGRVRFIVDEAAAQTAKLMIDARLLALALSVRQRRT